jgi:hypothetical protein
MELVFDDRGLLIPGVYDVSMDDVKEHFGQFQRTDRRPTLFAKLVEYLDALKRAGIGGSVIVDGSFVMANIDDPDDIDLVLVLSAGWDMQADLRPYQYNLVSRRGVRKATGFDLLVVVSGSTREKEWIDFFGQVDPKWSKQFAWPKSLRKGILRVLL